MERVLNMKFLNKQRFKNYRDKYRDKFLENIKICFKIFICLCLVKLLIFALVYYFKE